jgi:glycerol-3-phosphate dehydrogenase (NAD(P)+)
MRERESIVVIGGPCKANEVGSGRPTAVVFGAAQREAAEQARAVFQTAWYRIEVTDDVAGVEISAALKNVYAIALGVCQGLAGESGEPWHDLQAAVFAQAAREMAAVAVAVGGRAETAAGLAGVGDLEVTGLSGRNRIYGERIGRGEKPEQALQAMQDAGQTVEGVPAADLAMELLGQLSRTTASGPTAFPCSPPSTHCWPTPTPTPRPGGSPTRACPHSCAEHRAERPRSAPITASRRR